MCFCFPILVRSNPAIKGTRNVFQRPHRPSGRSAEIEAVGCPVEADEGRGTQSRRPQGRSQETLADVQTVLTSGQIWLRPNSLNGTLPLSALTIGGNGDQLPEAICFLASSSRCLPLEGPSDARTAIPRFRFLGGAALHRTADVQDMGCSKLFS
jgi:hypothetical protein